MYLMFVDESGDTGLRNSPTKNFILCGLVVHELRWRDTLDNILGFRKSLNAAYGLKLRDEIHAAELINSPGDLARIPKHQRLEILRRYADFLASLNDINLISILVDKTNKPTGYDVFEKAWQSLIQRFENTLSHQNFPGPKNSDDRGMLLCDHTDDKKLTALVRKLRNYNPVPNQAQYGAGYRNLGIRTVIEDPCFRDSKMSQFIQAVDTCSYLLQQQENPSKFMRKKGGQHYFKRLTSICCKVASRTDPNGIVRL